jgi:uncharacterized membrane protein
MENFEKETIDDVKTVLKSRKYVKIGGFMILVGTVLTFILYDWKLALILFLVIQGNEIAQRSNTKINEVIDKINNKTINDLSNKINNIE